MRLIVLLLTACSIFRCPAQAQMTRYLVKFKDKANSPYTLSNPSAYLSQRAIDRRAKYNIQLDSTDLPVTPVYLAQLAAVPNVTILNVSKWLNQVSIQTTDAAALITINALPFVQAVSPIAARTQPQGRGSKWSKFQREQEPQPPPQELKTETIAGDYYDYGTAAFNEIHLLNGEFLHNLGLHGETMQVALLDAGYYHYNSLAAFDSANTNGQILATWDFVKNEPSVAEDNSHGMSCLSTMAANIPGQFIGTSPKATFYLYRTEDVSSEYPVEEHNWVCAAERADSSGADIISSSLGYSTFDNATLNHSYADLDGKTTIAAKGAALAARKGMLLFIAAGNSGSDAWHYILTPADADSILAVGAVDINGNPGSFSSYGPSADGRVKPDIAAPGVGVVIATAGNTVGFGSGTSYACPKMAGLGTCLWQAFPEFSNVKIMTAIRQAGSISTTPNNRVGYGIPDMKKAFATLLTDYANSSASLQNCTVTLNWTSKDIGAMKYEIELKTAGDTSFRKIADINPVDGSVLAAHSYQFNYALNNTGAETLAFRIRQVIDTSATTYTAVFLDTTSMTIAHACVQTPPLVENHVTVSPNPFQDQLTVTIETNEAVPALCLRLYNMNGVKVGEYQASKSAGKAVFYLHLRHLAKGAYILVADDARQKIGTARLLRL
jgi:hypothetical protein